ncbi:MAG TPA: lysophospholipid acyltransferase family protein [Victivallales bacterium]|nr:lysophospholipid acyltransferase family protein [Victivallales bacterium]
MFKKKIREHSCAVISASRDGQYLSDLVSLFGVKPIRGSTKKNALSALNNSLREIQNGKNVCYTPDGPRGPAYHMSKGPIITASKTRRPILPISINYSKYWELRTWDKFRIPKPFSTVTLVIGEPIEIPPELNNDEIEKWCAIVQKKLNSIS